MALRRVLFEHREKQTTFTIASAILHTQTETLPSCLPPCWPLTRLASTRGNEWVLLAIAPSLFASQLY
jgi:hypothetical protein